MFFGARVEAGQEGECMINMLIADDEKDIIKLLRLYLEKENINIYEAYDGDMGYEILQNNQIDIAMVDIMMPGQNGFELIKKVRQTMDVPIIVLSARTDLTDRILGLDLGADDYITKPFEPLEVAAKIKSMIRRLNKTDEQKDMESLRVGDLVLDTYRCTILKNGQVIELTKTEYLVLKLFMENQGRVFTKEQIYNAGWNETYAVDDNTIRVIISRLRDKIGEEYIRTIRGLGYRMEKI